MSQAATIRLNISQNKESFKLILENQPPLFRYKYLEKILSPIQEDPEKSRKCTVKCLVRGCR